MTSSLHHHDVTCDTARLYVSLSYLVNHDFKRAGGAQFVEWNTDMEDSFETILRLNFHTISYHIIYRLLNKWCLHGYVTEETWSPFLAEFSEIMWRSVICNERTYIPDFLEIPKAKPCRLPDLTSWWKKTRTFMDSILNQVYQMFKTCLTLHSVKLRYCCGKRIPPLFSELPFSIASWGK